MIAAVTISYIVLTLPSAREMKGLVTLVRRGLFGDRPSSPGTRFDAVTS